MQKINAMNKLRLAMLPLFLMFAVCACEKDTREDDGDEENNSGTIVNDDEYYVKYIVNITYPYMLGKVNYATENGEGLFENRVRSWDETIGPVKKGFRAWVKVGNDKATCKIQVSKNSSAFATKTTGTGSASFTINY